MHSPGINGEGELRGQSANPGSRGKMAVKMAVCALSKENELTAYEKLLSVLKIRPLLFSRYLWQL